MSGEQMYFSAGWNDEWWVGRMSPRRSFRYPHYIEDTPTEVLPVICLAGLPVVVI